MFMTSDALLDATGGSSGEPRENVEAPAQLNEQGHDRIGREAESGADDDDANMAHEPLHDASMRAPRPVGQHPEDRCSAYAGTLPPTARCHAPV